MKSSRVLFGSVLVALAGLAFAAEPSVVVVDKAMNAEVVAVQSLQAAEPVNVLEITALQPVSDLVIATSESMYAVTHALVGASDPGRLCSTETGDPNRASLTAAVSAERSNSEVQKLTATSVKTFKI